MDINTMKDSTINVSKYVVPIDVTSTYGQPDVQYVVGSITDKQLHDLKKNAGTCIYLFVPFDSAFRVLSDTLTRLLNIDYRLFNRVSIFSIPIRPKDNNYHDTVANIVESYYQNHVQVSEVWEPSVAMDVGIL